MHGVTRSRCLDVVFYISAVFLTAKTTGVICLIGIGLGFGLTSWIIYKVYVSSQKKRKKPSRRKSSDSSILGSAVRDEGIGVVRYESPANGFVVVARLSEWLFYVCLPAAALAGELLIDLGQLKSI